MLFSEALHDVCVVDHVDVRRFYEGYDCEGGAARGSTMTALPPKRLNREGDVQHREDLSREKL